MLNSCRIYSSATKNTFLVLTQKLLQFSFSLSHNETLLCAIQTGKVFSVANSTLSMPFWKYLKPLRANEFGACRAVGRNQLRPNVQNCSSPLSYVFSPLLYRLSYQAKSWDYIGSATLA